MTVELRSLFPYWLLAEVSVSSFQLPAFLLMGPPPSSNRQWHTEKNFML